MLRLTTANGERLEIPGYAIIAVMKPSDGIYPCAIIFDMGAGPQVDQLCDQYGHVKKLAIDSQAFVNPIEVRVIEQVQVGQGDEAVAAFAEGRMFFARDRILGRREVKGDPNGVNATIFVNLLGSPMAISTGDTLNEMDGEEPHMEGAAPLPTESASKPQQKPVNRRNQHG